MPPAGPKLLEVHLRNLRGMPFPDPSHCDWTDPENFDTRLSCYTEGYWGVVLGKSTPLLHVLCQMRAEADFVIEIKAERLLTRYTPRLAP